MLSSVKHASVGESCIVLNEPDEATHLRSGRALRRVLESRYRQEPNGGFLRSPVAPLKRPEIARVHMNGPLRASALRTRRSIIPVALAGSSGCSTAAG